MKTIGFVLFLLMQGVPTAYADLAPLNIDIAGPLDGDKTARSITEKAEMPDENLPIRRELIEATILPSGEVVETARHPYDSLKDIMTDDATTPKQPDDDSMKETSNLGYPFQGIFAPNARIGAEGRVDVNVKKYPNTAVARLAFKKGTSSYSCTGWRGSRRVLLTNGHCVYDKSSKKFHHSFRIDFGYRNGTYVQRAHPILVVVSKWYQQGKSGVDWGFLIMKKNAKNKTGWLGTRNYSTSWNNKNYWYVSQYASNMTKHPFSTAYQTRNKYRGKIANAVYSGRAVFHNVDTGQGASGSPVWSYWKVNNKYLPYSVAINYGGWGPRNKNRMSSCSPFKWGKCGNVGTRASVFLKILKQYIKKYPN